MVKKDRLDIVFEDKNILVINKPAHLLTISTDNEKERTLFHKVYLYCNKKNQKVFIVHRLDKDTSGLIVFAKNEKAKNILQKNWDSVKRSYIAIVDGIVENKEKTLKNYLAETKTLMTYVTDSKNGKLALTHYRKVRTNKLYTLLDIEILTGRKNQIRVQLNEIGHPILGDRKYGNGKDPIRRLCLHAYKLEFNHPITNEVLKFETDVPNSFVNLIN